jgi:hypothetical protein
MKIHKFFGKNPELLKQIVFKTFKQKIDTIISPLIKYTTTEKPVPFLLNSDFEFADKKQDHSLIIFGKQMADWKEFGKLVAKEELGVLGLAYYGGQNTDEQTKIHLNIAKGSGKTKLKKLEKSLYRLFPKTTYELILSAIEADDFDLLEQNDDIEYDDIEDEVDEKLILSDEKLTKLLNGNLKKISDLFVPIKKQSDISGIQEEIVDLLEYIDIWQELLTENLSQAQTLGLDKQKIAIQNIEDMLRRFGNDQNLWTAWKSVKYLKDPMIRNDKNFIQNLCGLQAKTDLQDHIFKGEYSITDNSIASKGLHFHSNFKTAPPSNIETYGDGDVMMFSEITRIPNPPLDDQPYSGYFNMFSKDLQRFQLGMTANKKQLLIGTKHNNDFGWSKTKKSTFFPLNWTKERVLEECAYSFCNLTIASTQKLTSPCFAYRGNSTSSFIIEILILKTNILVAHQPLTIVGNSTLMSDVQTMYPIK